MTDLQRLAYAFFGDVECAECGTTFSVERIRFTSAPEEVECDLLSEYECVDCGVEYDLLAEDQGDRLFCLWEREDKHWFDSRYATKPHLYERAHPARNLIEGLRTLDTLTNMLLVSKKRLEGHADIRDRRLDNPMYATLVFSDTHNYLATAYSLDEAIKGVSDVVPTDVDLPPKGRYEESCNVIIGLRIFVQHYRHFPIKVDLDDPPICTFEVELDEVTEMGGSGYRDDAEEYYGDVEGDKINLSERVATHYQNTRSYVDALTEYCRTEYADELEDFQEKTSTASLRSSQ